MSELVNESSHTYDFGNIDDMDPSLGNLSLIYITINTSIITNIVTNTNTNTNCS